MGQRDANHSVTEGWFVVPKRPPRPDSMIREQAIANCVRERLGFEPLAPVTRLRVASLDSTTSESGIPRLPSAPARGPSSIVLAIPAALAGMLFSAVVVLALPLGSSTLDDAEGVTPTPPVVAPNHARNAEGVTIENRSKDVTERRQGSDVSERVHPVIKPCRAKVND